jgi:hypothetical protein
MPPFASFFHARNKETAHELLVKKRFNQAIWSISKPLV